MHIEFVVVYTLNILPVYAVGDYVSLRMLLSFYEAVRNLNLDF